MSTRVLGVGVGVLIIAVIWIIAILFAIVFIKAKRPISFLGFGSIALACLISVILLCIPRSTNLWEPELDLLPPDFLFIWRSALLVFLALCLVAGVILMVTEHWSVPVYAKPLRKGFSRNVSILKDTASEE